MADGESVRVAVRVRPFNQREKDRDSKLCVRMLGPTTTVINPEDGKDKSFTFDFSYWSHDGERARPDGYNECGGEGMGTDGATYADQKKVFDDLGQGVLNNAYEGYNSCLFAYGQTGAGKSYSMVGYGVNKGIVPISCDEIFKRIEEQKANFPDKFQFQVTIQMLEIYNEQVRDLFAKSNPSGGLKVRMNPKSGVEVVGLSEWPVGSYQEIDERIETATKNRTVASTNMNATSSRAHTVVTITYTQKQLELNAKGPGKHSEKKAKMNLVDLAGSERAESTGATGDRLKEGAAINLSLTMLGNVITALAERSNNPHKKVLIPYRDSKLTCILQDALGGNSKTIMVCAISPADINYEETVGTLRYADRAKQIKNKPKVNIDPTEVLIQQLKEENERLKQQMGSGGGPPGTVMTDEEKEMMKKQLEDEMAAKMAENEKMLAEMSKSWEEKLKEAQEKAAAEGAGANSEHKRRETEPHILNINEDPVLSRAICYFFPLGEEINIGNRDRPGEEEILLGGVSIRPDHCRVTNTDGTLIMGVRDECKVLLNGADVTGKNELELHHNDRLLIGTNYYFVVVHPTERDASTPEEGWPEVTWDMFQREIAKAQGLNVDVNWAAMTEEEKRRALLNDELVQVMPRVQEANALSAELKRDINFETKVTSVMHKTEGTVSVVMVKVVNEATSAEFIWEKDKFINRVYLMRELYTKFMEGTLDPNLFNGEQDPFWDPIEPMNIGYSTIYLKPLSFCMPAEDDYAIYYDSQQAGIMHVKIEPCKPDGAVVDDEEEDGIYDDVENPKDLLGRRLDVLVTVSYARGINKKFSSEVYIEFEFPKVHNPEREDGRFYTNSVRDTMNPNFDFKKQITWERVDDILLHFLETGSAYFHVFGLQEDKSGTSVQRKKMLSMQQVEELQANFKKMTDDKERGDDIMGKVLERSVVAGHNSEATESFLLEIANLLADAGFDVQGIVDAAQTSSKKLEQTVSTDNATPEDRPAGGDAGELSAKLEEAMKQIADKDAALKASEEHVATISKLKEKIAELEASKPSEGGGGETPGQPQPSTSEEEMNELRSKAAMVEELQAKIAKLESKDTAEPTAEPIAELKQDHADYDKQLEEARALLSQKEAELAEAKAAGEKARSLVQEQEEKHKAELAEKEKEWKSQQQTPDNEEHLKKIIELKDENSKYKEEIIQLKGQLDLARLEAETAKKAGSKGCNVQ